jgi:hypothetical protein
MINIFKRRKKIMSTFKQFTRVYKVDATGAIKTQPITINTGEIATFRASNKLTPSGPVSEREHRSTITLKNGTKYNISTSYSDLSSMLTS